MARSNHASSTPPPVPAAPRKPLPLRDCPVAVWQSVLGVMTDIDDTLTCHGAIEPPALQALHDLAAAGLPVLAITGRPVGWSRPFAQAWPLRAIVAENGAVALLPTAAGVLTEYTQDDTTRAAHARRLQRVAQDIVQQVPGAALAQDSAGRETDIAIDHSESAHLSPQAIAQVVALMQAAGMNATVSSIHINGWFGSHTKFSGAQWMVQRLWGRPLQPELHRWVYVGDSTNDQLMFEHFPCSVGVANLMRFANDLRTWPAYITQAQRGAGFAELVRTLLQARQHSPA
jgi:HAD superfamily hydrolase (TIGR01484 family)